LKGGTELSIYGENLGVGNQEVLDVKLIHDGTVKSNCSGAKIKQRYVHNENYFFFVISNF